MKKLIALYLLLLPVALAAQSGTEVVRAAHGDVAGVIETRKTEHPDSEGRISTVIQVEKTARGKYTVAFEFIFKPESFPYSSFVTVIDNASTEVVRTTLRSGERLDYTFRSVPGVVNPANLDKDFIYRLPYREGVAGECRNLSTAAGQIDFMLPEVTMIHAMRKGEVVLVEDTRYGTVMPGVSYAPVAGRNVHVEHNDGTVAIYLNISPSSLGVKPGDVVFPSTPLGLAGTDGHADGQLSVRLYYQRAPYLQAMVPDIENVTREYIDPVFLTEEGPQSVQRGRRYTATVTDALIEKEMTRREKRARQ